MKAIPWGTSRTPDKLERAREFGLAGGFATRSAPTAEDGKQWSAAGVFDIVIDLAGGPYVNASLHALAPHGRMMLVGTVAGAKSEIELGLMLGKRVRMIGTVLRARPLEEKIIVTRAFASEVLPLFASGSLRPAIDSVFKLEDVRRAHEQMESNRSFGKIVLSIGG